MADKTEIEWTEATWNPITGCSIATTGCAHCYAMKLAGTRLRHHPSRAGLTVDTKNGPVWTGEVRFNEGWLTQPLQWKRPRMIFVCAHGDLFHESVPDEWIDRVFAVMALAPHHTFQVLTKRAERLREYCLNERRPFQIARAVVDMMIAGNARVTDCWPVESIGDVDDPDDIVLRTWPLTNVWLGVSSERQQEADERIPHLLATPAAVRWLSAEPLLGPIDLTAIDDGLRDGVRLTFDALTGLACDGENTVTGIFSQPDAKLDWVVAGGESGDGSRPMHPGWARSLRDQCAAAGVPFFFKQWGAHVHGSQCDLTADDPWSEIWIDDATVVARVGKKRAGRLLDGIEHNAMPEIATE